MLPEPPLLAAFALASILLIVSPGPDTLYVASRSVGQGRFAGVIAAFGISSGIVVHSIIVATGLAGLLTLVPLAYDAVRLAGAAYLLYLAWAAFAGRERADIFAAAATPRRRLFRVYREALFTNVLNPKVAVFFLAFLPQFTDPAKGSLALQILSLAALFFCGGFAYLLVVALTFGAIGGWLKKRPAFARAQRWTMGAVLGAMAVWLAWPERR